MSATLEYLLWAAGHLAFGAMPLAGVSQTMPTVGVGIISQLVDSYQGNSSVFVYIPIYADLKRE